MKKERDKRVERIYRMIIKIDQRMLFRLKKTDTIKVRWEGQCTGGRIKDHRP